MCYKKNVEFNLFAISHIQMQLMQIYYVLFM